MNIFFICKANVGRSQIAETFFNSMSKKHHAFSAGTHVAGNDGQALTEFDSVIKSMTDAGYDLSKNTRKQLNLEMVKKADKIVVITDKDDLPDYLKDSPKLIFWKVDDAKDKSYEFHIKIRDQIKNLVENLVKEID